MSIKIIIAIVLVIAIVLGGAGYTISKISFASGASSRDSKCAEDRAADTKSFLQVKAEANAAGAKAQKEEDAHALVEVKRQLNEAIAAVTIAQRIASESKAKSEQLSSNLERLKNENQNVHQWSDSCLPPALLASLHPQGNGQADSGCPR